MNTLDLYLNQFAKRFAKQLRERKNVQFSYSRSNKIKRISKARIAQGGEICIQE